MLFWVFSHHPWLHMPTYSTNIFFDFILFGSLGSDRPEFCIVSAKAVSQRLNNRIMSAFTKGPLVTLLKAFEKLNLLQQLCNLNYFTLHRKSICIFDKSQIYSLERNWIGTDAHNIERIDKIHCIMWWWKIRVRKREECILSQKKICQLRNSAAAKMECNRIDEIPEILTIPQFTFFCCSNSARKSI